MHLASFIFLIFLGFVYIVWRSLPYESSKRWLCFSSFFFYAYWFPPFFLIMVTCGLINYVVALYIEYRPQNQKKLLILSISSNLIILFMFKYINIIQDLFGISSNLFSAQRQPNLLDLILPMGLSFFTFQSIGYTIDIYRGKIKACRNIVDFFLYLSFFPRLVAGPIVQAPDFISQLHKKKIEVDWNFVFYRIVRGFFLKLVIADNLAISVNYIFSLPIEKMTTLISWLGAVSFAVQIFCDFSGYSDIAIGAAAMFGFRLNENFNFPYLAQSLSDFWRRWHISLYNWIKDYLYIPLGGNRNSPLKNAWFLFFIFMLIGLWHGTKMTFIFWGFINALALIIEKLIFSDITKKNNSNKFFKLSGPLFTLLIILLSWIPFRTTNIDQAYKYWKIMFAGPIGNTLGFSTCVFFIGLFLATHILAFLSLKKGKIKNFEIPLYFSLILTLSGTTRDFIYFHF